MLSVIFAPLLRLANCEKVNVLFGLSTRIETTGGGSDKTSVKEERKGKREREMERV
jgi:hypothetical protein